MADPLLELFRTLSSFSPARRDLSKAPWADYVDWAIAQGLAPLAAWALEYRLGSVGAPDWARQRMLALYQGTANDNVMKLVGFKNSVKELEGRRLVLLGGASFAESLYPHVAFRPVIEIEVLLSKTDVGPFAAWLRRAGFVEEAPSGGADLVVSDGRTSVLIFGGLVADPAEAAAVLKRAEPVKAYGPSVYRPVLEDALLLHVLRFARAGFERPYIEWLDLREAVLGAPSVSGPYSRAPDAATVLARAKAWKLDRALWASLEVVARLFPEARPAAERLMPELSFPVRELLGRAVVEPLAEVGRLREFKGAEALRQALVGS